MKGKGRHFRPNTQAPKAPKHPRHPYAILYRVSTYQQGALDASR